MTDIELLTLHGLAVKKAGNAASVAGIVGREESEVAPALEAAVAAGQRHRREGHLHGHAGGRSWLDDRYPEAYADFRADPESTAARTSASSASTASCSPSSPTGR